MQLILRLFVSVSWLALVSALRVLVPGATGKLGRLVVNELLKRDGVTAVPIARNETKAREVLQVSEKVDLKIFDLQNNQELESACADVDAVIWCASQTIEPPKFFDKVREMLFGPREPIDISAVREIGRHMATKSGSYEGPRFVICSSAGVTRPGWSIEKKANLVGAADIPIVRLNPMDILGTKLKSEMTLRESGAQYTVVRPCGLNDNWPQGRVVLSQGDVAVGRMCRVDAAAMLVATLFEKNAVGKTFECMSIAGYPQPRSFSEQFSRLLSDSSSPLDEKFVLSQYAVMQQLVPGETLAPNALAMGQTYEQLDKGEQGRLGPRGAEKVPARLGGNSEDSDVGVVADEKKLLIY